MNCFIRIFTVIGLISCIGLSDIDAQNKEINLIKKYESYQEKTLDGMDFGLFVPDNNSDRKSYPLLLYLHGYSDTVSHDQVWYQESFQSEYPCFIVTPKSHGSTFEGTAWGTSWDSATTKDANSVIDIVDSICKSYAVDRNRLYIYGASMGGHGVYNLLLRFPDRFAAACIICGAGDFEKAEQFKNTPLWIFHGENDTIVPTMLSREMYKRIKESGGNQVRYTEYKNTGHDSWNEVAHEKTLYKWLFSQGLNSKHSTPRPIREYSISYETGKAYMKWSSTTRDDSIWYYKIYRNHQLIAEVDADECRFEDNIETGEGYFYVISAVNYWFQESDTVSQKTIIE